MLERLLWITRSLLKLSLKKQLTTWNVLQHSPVCTPICVRKVEGQILVITTVIVLVAISKPSYEKAYHGEVGAIGVG